MPNKPTTLRESLEELRYKWRGYAVVDDAFESSDISFNADRIADWWLEKLTSHNTELLQKIEKHTFTDMGDYYAVKKIINQE